MIRFLRDNSYDIFKMAVNQFGMTFFGLVLSFPTHNNDTLFICSSVFAILFYMMLLYTMTWDIGYGEKIRIEGKRLRYVPLKGLFLSLAANIVNILLGILINIGYYSASAYIIKETGAVAPFAPDFSVNLYGVCKAIANLIEGMYTGLIETVFVNFPIVYLLIVVPALVTCTAAYIMGVKGKRLFRFLGPKESKE